MSEPTCEVMFTVCHGLCVISLLGYSIPRLLCHPSAPLCLAPHAAAGVIWFTSRTCMQISFPCAGHWARAEGWWDWNNKYQLSKCSKSGKVTRFSQSRPCLEGTAQQTPLGTRFSLAGQCAQPFSGGPALKPNVFASAHYRYIPLTFIFKLFCLIYCPGISPRCPPQQLTMYLDISFCWGSFLQCLHYRLTPSQPSHCSSVHKLQSTSVLSDRQVFKANYQLCQGAAGRGGGPWRHVFPSKRMESAQQTKMFWARKLSRLASNCWL